MVLRARKICRHRRPLQPARVPSGHWREKRMKRRRSRALGVSSSSSSKRVRNEQPSLQDAFPPVLRKFFPTGSKIHRYSQEKKAVQSGTFEGVVNKRLAIRPSGTSRTVYWTPQNAFHLPNPGDTCLIQNWRYDSQCRYYKAKILEVTYTPVGRPQFSFHWEGYDIKEFLPCSYGLHAILPWNQKVIDHLESQKVIIGEKEITAYTLESKQPVDHQ